MQILLSIPRLMLAVLALALFHLAAGFLVLVYAVIALAVGMGRWCRDVWVRASRRQRRPGVPLQPVRAVGP
ncbi:MULTISPECIES: hypothetical protein [unclassified Microbacterium]|uniref:hypothetical protein n=1 Tax=unclassified Microbacterium TaxID=2609290 RepID=UPI00214A9DAE|nr:MULTISPECIES: hypothetical protein [unclassified Microbacterium]MCR2783514.1 hypothetical protein [Microbacterium sp. zg.B96]MDL5351698.1 hypothetical protein [Microbacterium sp. zg-YB36]WIM15624.1 hypothetical protein QNO11_13950 [Microbacterium sp. zg-B96]